MPDYHAQPKLKQAWAKVKRPFEIVQCKRISLRGGLHRLYCRLHVAQVPMGMELDDLPDIYEEPGDCTLVRLPCSERAIGSGSVYIDSRDVPIAPWLKAKNDGAGWGVAKYFESLFPRWSTRMPLICPVAW